MLWLQSWLEFHYQKLYLNSCRTLGGFSFFLHRVDFKLPSKDFWTSFLPVGSISFTPLVWWIFQLNMGNHHNCNNCRLWRYLSLYTSRTRDLHPGMLLGLSYDGLGRSHGLASFWTCSRVKRSLKKNCNDEVSSSNNRSWYEIFLGKKEALQAEGLKWTWYFLKQQVFEVVEGCQW